MLVLRLKPLSVSNRNRMYSCAQLNSYRTRVVLAWEQESVGPDTARINVRTERVKYDEVRIMQTELDEGTLKVSLSNYLLRSNTAFGAAINGIYPPTIRFALYFNK